MPRDWGGRAKERGASDTLAITLGGRRGLYPWRSGFDTRGWLRADRGAERERAAG